MELGESELALGVPGLMMTMNSRKMLKQGLVCVALVAVAMAAYRGRHIIHRLLIEGRNYASSYSARPTTLPEATLHQSYEARLPGTGGSGADRVVRSGVLPPGIVLNPDGALSGTPEVPGDFYFNVAEKVPPGGAVSIGKAMMLPVNGSGLAILATDSNLPWGRVGLKYEIKLTAGGAGPKYSWSLSGQLPDGLSIFNDGTIGGTPKPGAGGDYTFTARVSSDGQQASRQFSLHISPTELDEFGGVMAMPSVQGATGYWHTEKMGNRWVLVTPAGHAFWMIGVWGLDGDQHTDPRGMSFDQYQGRKYGNRLMEAWTQSNRRLRSWGFNTIGPWTYRMALPTNPKGADWGGEQKIKFPFVCLGPNASISGRAQGAFKNLYAGMDQKLFHMGMGTHANFPDVFDPAWVRNTKALWEADEDLKTKEKSPYYVGAFSDDTDYTMGFGPGLDFDTQPPDKYSPHLGFVALATAPQQTDNPYAKSGVLYKDSKVYTKYALRDFLEKKYKTIAALNAAWGSDYTTFDSDGGWPNGSGLLDENGRPSHTWLGHSDADLGPKTKDNPNVVKDLNEFLYLIAKQFFSVQRDGFRSVSPHGVFFGITSVGGWWAPARAPIYKAAGEYLDVVSVTPATNQQQLDFITRNTGDVPLMIWQGIIANQDSGLWRAQHEEPANWRLPTQEARGAKYQHDMQFLFDSVSSKTGSHPFLGMLWWTWQDSVAEQKNWGLVSVMDNAYDGVEATMNHGVDAWGFPIGGEERNYGNFIGPARATNYWVMDQLATEGSHQAGKQGGTAAGKR